MSSDADAVLPDYVEAVEDADEITLTRLRERVAEARDLSFEIDDLELQIAEKRKALTKLLHQTLPEVLDTAGVPSITLEATGNMPAMVATVKSFYNANIAAAWDDEKKARAFKVLEDHQAGALIKSTIDVALPANQYEDAKALHEKLCADGFDAQISKGVHRNTLTAWLKEQIESGRHIPLDEIGGFVGRIVTLKAKEDADGKKRNR